MGAFNVVCLIVGVLNMACMVNALEKSWWGIAAGNGFFGVVLLSLSMLATSS